MPLTTEERLERTDEEIEAVKSAFVEAVTRLADEPAVDSSFDERLGAVVSRLNELGTDLQPADYDKDQLAALFKNFWAIRDLVDAADGRPDLDTCNELLIGIERIRHVVRDAIDEHVTGVAGDRGLVIDDLRAWLPHTPAGTIADLVGVDRRTLSRWSSEPAPPSPRLALVARLVAILRHSWTEAGIVGWFDRPRRDLDGRRPRALLTEPAAEDDLISAARSGRSQYAA